MVSPKTAELFKAVNYPVDYAHGVPNVSIPLYTVKVNDIEVPITLSYHASGIKVYDQASYVGLGWSLSGEPAVSRLIQGGADENGLLQNTNLNTNDKSVLNNAVATNFQFLDETPDEFYYSLSGASGKFFLRRQPGDAVGYYKLITLPEKPYKFSVNIINTSETLKRIQIFKITDDKGIQYFFGKSANNVDAYELNASSGASVSWKGTEIVSANVVDTVFFKYHPIRAQITAQQALNTITITDSLDIALSPSLPTPPDNMYHPSASFSVCSSNQCPYEYNKYQSVPSAPNTPVQKVLNSTYNEPTGLTPGELPGEVVTNNLYTSEILFRGGKVIFQIEDDFTSKLGFNNQYRGTPRLSRLLVEDAAGNSVREVKFYYSYFTSGTTDTNSVGPIALYTWRRKLDSLVITNVGNTQPEIYRFGYIDNDNMSGFRLNCTDFWGYNRGRYPTPDPYFNVPVTTLSGVPDINLHLNFPVPGGTSTTPHPPFAFNAGSGVPNALENAGQECTLNKIYYPTGGYTEFKYEPSKYINLETNEVKVVGGIRVKQIIDFDHVTGKIKYRTFKYGVNEVGGGYIRYGIERNPYDYCQTEQYVFNYRIPATFLYTGGTETIPVNYYSRERTIRSSAVADLFYTNGAVVAYPEVTEYEGDSTDNNGKTIYKYNFPTLGSYPSTTPSYYQGTALAYDIKLDWSWGTLAQRIVYKNSGAGYEPVTRYSANYNVVLSSDKVWSRGVWASSPVRGDVNYNFSEAIAGTSYKTLVNEYRTGIARLISDTTVTYGERNTQFVSINDYTYDNASVETFTKRTTTNSDGSVTEVRNTFPSDITGLSPTLTSQAEQGRQTLLLQNRLAFPLQVATVRNGNVLEQIRSNYAPNGSGTVATLTDIEKYLRTNSQPATKSLINVRDQYGNPLEVQMEGDVKHCYLWGYKGLYPVAEVVGADYATVSAFITQSILDNPLSTDQQMRTELNKIRTGLASTKAMVVTYTYKPLIGMTSETNANGRTTYYEYDNMGRLRLVRDHDNNVLKKICYNYAGQPEYCNVFYNVVKSGSYTRNTCPTGYGGSTVTYTVAANTYSAPSQPAADALAQNDVNNNGQAYANANGICRLICTGTNCTAEGQRCVGGFCETGVKICTGSTQVHGSLWQITYHYEFSDGFISQNYTENSSSPCSIE